jgi:ABC-2 type transport system ATP-binding protein
VRELIKNLARDKIVIISTHILEEVSAVCSRAIIIARGEIVADGTPAELEAKSRYHNAVTVRFSEPCDCVAPLEQIKNVRGVEADPELEHCFTVLSEESRSIYGDVAALVQHEGWPVEELHVNRGLLEDVFRSVTAPAERQTEAA